MTRVDPGDQELTSPGAVLSGGSNRAARNFATQRETLSPQTCGDLLVVFIRLYGEAGCIGADRAATAVLKMEGQ